MSNAIDSPDVSGLLVATPLAGRYSRALEVITVPAEPGTAPPPAWSAMSTGLDGATRFPYSRLPPLARSAVPYAAPGYVMPVVPLATLAPAPLIESDVADNAEAAPHHGQRRAARERAGIRAALRATRTGERYAAIAVA